MGHVILCNTIFPIFYTEHKKYRMRTFLLSIAFLNSVFSISQSQPIKIVDEKSNNRLALYAVNDTETDYDVLLSVKGTNFR
ncbi:hypothetical protein MTsPCn5_05930 [Croceitalea sp. MTPC5]|nr:hypothetical protein MTsPCn5_05930 [Croceitalea sp. MTPC5]